MGSDGFCVETQRLQRKTRGGLRGITSNLRCSARPLPASWEARSHLRHPSWSTLLGPFLDTRSWLGSSHSINQP